MTSERDSASSLGARIGLLLGGKYRLTRLLGRGGMGEVYEARHMKIERRVAIKLLLPELAMRPELLLRFEQEARAAGGLSHENIVSVYDVGVDGEGARYLVMEYLEGEDCASYLKRMGPLSSAEAVAIVVQACRGVEAAHQAGIIHRDLKPANLLLARRADGQPLVKVLDFGIAKLRTAGEGTEDLSAGASALSGAVGTPHYMAPEQVRGASVGPLCDVYALGVVLFELLSGQKPYVGSSTAELAYQIVHGAPRSLSSLRDGLPSALCKIVAQAMARAEVERFASVQQLRMALSELARAGELQHDHASALDVTHAALPDTQPSPVTRPATVSDTPPPKRAAQKPKVARVALLTGALMVAGVIGLIAVRRDQQTKPQDTRAMAARPLMADAGEDKASVVVAPPVIGGAADASQVAAPSVVNERALSGQTGARPDTSAVSHPQPAARAAKRLHSADASVDQVANRAEKPLESPPVETLLDAALVRPVAPGALRVDTQNPYK